MTNILQLPSAVDCAAIYSATASIDELASKKYHGSLSARYSGGDEFLRAAFAASTAFEQWACAHVDFDSITDCWPYLLRDRFAEAVEAVTAGVLCLRELGPSDWEKVAEFLGVELLATA